MVGPQEKPLDTTDKYFLISSNVISSCMSSFGPEENNPDTGKPYGLVFPFITMGDMVQAQTLLLDHLGIDKLFAPSADRWVGMQVLEWATRFHKAFTCGGTDCDGDPPVGAEYRIP